MKKNNQETEAQGAEVQNEAKKNAEVIHLNPEKPTSFARNLEQTMQLVHDLFQKKRQRDKLVVTIDHLSSFEIEQKENYLDIDTKYTGSKIKFIDDKGREITLSNPALVQDAIDHLKNRCIEKLAEIESEIVIPA